jgi:nucleotide-binding universal stress UspA family protein
VPMTALIAKYFEAEIHLLAIYTTSFKDVRQRVDEYVQQVERYLVENEVKFVSEQLEAENITDSTIDYATKINANLISIMDEQERKASNLWLGPYAQQMINQSPIPVLSIHARNVIAGVSR